MRLKRRYLAFGAVMLMALIFPIFAAAQDTQPTITPTPIPIEVGNDDESAAPSLDSAPPPAATEDVTEVPANATTGAGSDMLASGPVCPTLVQESFTATEFVCESVATGEACIGNGTVESTFGAADTGASFSSPGDTIRLTSLEEMRLRSTSVADGVWTVVSSRIELKSTDGAIPVGVPMLLFGDVTFSDTGQITGGTARNATVIAGRGLNVRRTPGNDGVVVWQLDAGEQILVTGISRDGQWIRLQIPNRFSGIGWAYAPYLEVDGGAESLAYVTIDSPLPDLTPPEFGAMQAVELLTANSAPNCDAIDSGILLQSPSGLPDMVRIRINSVEIQLSGTAYIQAQADAVLTVNLLEGEAIIIVDDAETAITVGSRATVSLNSNLQPTGSPQVSSISLADFAALPSRLLPRQILLGSSAAAFDSEEDDPIVSEPTQAIGFGTPPPTNTPTACTLTAPANTTAAEPKNLRSGPGTEFAVVRGLQSNESVTGIGQINIGGFIWYVTNDSAWIRFDAVTASSSCGTLPLVEAPPLPQPTATPTPEAEVVAMGLTSSLLGDVTCPDGRVSSSGTSDGRDFSIALGGTWTAQAGTTVTFTTQGGQLRPEFGDYIQLVGADGTFIAGSESGVQLQVTFDEATTFIARFSAANRDVIVMQAVCNG